MTRLFPVVGLLALCSLLGVAAPAAAQTADELIQEGIELRRQQRDADALERFQRAYEMSRSGQALAQIALAEQALGRFVDAEEHLSAALNTQMDPWVASRRAQLQDALSTIRAQLGTLEITGGVPGAQVFVNGELRGTLPEAASIRVRAGSAAIELRAQGYLSVQRQVMVAAGGTARENVQMVAAAGTPGQTVAPPPPQQQQGYQGQGQYPAQGQYQAQVQPVAQPAQQQTWGTPQTAAPPQYETRPRWGLFVAGTVIFAVPWVITWASGFAFSDEDGAIGLIPIAGPFVLMANFEEFELFSLGWLLVLDGLAQTAGIIMAIVGLASQTQVEVRAQLGPGDRAPELALHPIDVPGGAGLGLTLTHF